MKDTILFGEKYKIEELEDAFEEVLKMDPNYNKNDPEKSTPSKSKVKSSIEFINITSIMIQNYKGWKSRLK